MKHDKHLHVEQRLRDRIAELEEENRQLRESLLRAPAWPREWRIAGRSAQLLSALWAGAGEYLPAERLELAIWGGHSCGANNLRVALYHLSRRLVPLGVEIENWRGHGWAIRGESREVLKSLIS